MVLAVLELNNMEVIQLKSNVNWCKHELHQLTPIHSELHPDEKVFKLESPYKYKVIRSSQTSLPIEVVLTYGPTLCVGQEVEQLGMVLKEVCKAWNSEGETFNALVFYDMSGNEETGTV